MPTAVGSHGPCDYNASWCSTVCGNATAAVVSNASRPSIEVLLAVPASSMCRVLVVALVGIACSQFPRRPRPLLHADARRDVGALMINIAWPAMAVSTLGATISPATFGDTWPVVVWAIAHIGIGGAICLALSHLLYVPREFRPAFVVAGTFANSAALPMLVMETLCEHPVLVSGQTDTSECRKLAFGYIMVYTAVWSLGMFLFAVPYIQWAAPAAPGKEAEMEAGVTMDIGLAPRAATEAHIAVDKAVALPVVPRDSPVDVAVDDAAPQDDAAEGGSTCTVAAVRHSVPRQHRGRMQNRQCCSNVCSALSSPPIVATIIGIIIGLIQPLATWLFRNSGGVGSAIGGSVETLAEPGVACSTVVMAAALMPDPVPVVPTAATALTKGAPTRSRRHCCGCNGPVGFRPVALLCAIRLVLLPACGFGAFRLMQDSGAFAAPADLADPAEGRRRLGNLIILIECASPSAQTAVVVMAKMGMHLMARRLAFVYVFEYSLAIFTLALWTALALFLLASG